MTRRASTQTRFGKYRLLRRLARGGMAEIFLARYEAAAGISKIVVVKKILPAFAENPRFLKMFIDEARVTVGLSHGNIAQVFDFGEIEGSYYLAMEYVAGQSLSSVLTRTTEAGLAFPIPIACFVTMEMLKGLGYSHRKCDEAGQPLGIVHRDVSPQNVMISYEGQVKVVDFGIAKAATVAGETQAGALKGKFLYFAPEQARSRPIDARTDLCATGIVFYELLTGRRPYAGVLLDVLEAILEGRFPRPRALNPEIPPSLERIVLQAMALDPDDRYPSAARMQEAIGGFLFKAAPRFTSASVAHFVRYLYREEIEASGQTVELPASFLEQIPLWEKHHDRAPPTDPGTGNADTDSHSPTTAPREDAETGAGTVASAAEFLTPPPGSRPVFPVPSRKQIPRPVLWGALGALLALVVGAAGLTAARSLSRTEGAGQVRIESEPPGARIFLDGEDTGQETPYIFQGLLTGRAYGLTLVLEGHRPRLAEFEPSATGSTTVSYPLLLAAAPAPPTQTTDLAAIEGQIRAAAAREARNPGSSLGGALRDLAGQMGERKQPTSPTVQRVRVQMIDIRRLNALGTRLAPKLAHTLSLTGAAFLTDPMLAAPATRCFYVVARTRGDRSRDRGVLSTADPLHLPAGATRVYFILAADNPKGGSGHLQVRIAPEQGRAKELSLDPRRHAFSPLRRGLPVLEKMNVTLRYEIDLGDAPPPFYTRGPSLGAWSGLKAPEPVIGVLRDGIYLRGGVDLRVFDLGLRPRKARILKIVATVLP